MADDERAPDPAGRVLDEMAGRPLGAEDEQTLAQCLSHGAKPIRLKAAEMLADAVSSGRAPAALCERLLGSTDARARWGAAFAASRAGLRSQQVLDVAIEALDFEDGDVRWAAASIVTREARESEPLRTRLRSLASLGTPRSRKLALLCLCESGVIDGDFYRRALGDEDPFVRLAAVTSLARSGDASPQSLEALRTASQGDEDARVRRGAGAVLSRLSARAGRSERSME
jgi:HEAT repeat protein